MTFLIQLLLPRYSNAGVAFSDEMFGEVAKELTGRFGGVTAYTRAPAKGFWKSAGSVHDDDIVVLEVMAEGLDREWWGKYRDLLEQRFQQQELVIRANKVERL